MKLSYFFTFCLCLSLSVLARAGAISALEANFEQPPESARPWVYWYFMDGNLTRDGMTADLEAMQRAGIGGAIFLEVGIGIPRGPVEFMSPEWQKLFHHAAMEADRLGIELALGTGPGWCGTGGPWVKPAQAMKHLVASETQAHGPVRFDAILPKPEPRNPYFGTGQLTPGLMKAWRGFDQVVAVLAYPTPEGALQIPEIDEKALYYRAPFSSKPGVKPFLAAPSAFPELPPAQCVSMKGMVDLTSRLQSDGHLSWDVPPGDWTIQRFGITLTGQTTRPAPVSAIGFESDKFDPAAVAAHLVKFPGPLLEALKGKLRPGRGLTTLHFDSWEMGSQNWSGSFREDFRKRRGYDPLLMLPAMIGRVVRDAATSERFLWDLRQTAQELVIENHMKPLKDFAHQQGLRFSSEPYDMDPCSDLEMGAVADVPMCEFWSQGYGFSSEYSCFEAVSIAHTNGRSVVAAEAFTASGGEAWHQFPGSMKAQGDWALCTGINRFAFHRFQHQPVAGKFPGMTMGPYGVYWDRTQTWWDMVPAYHTYLSRCNQMLRQGLPVADILYLAPEGAPHVFRAPRSATEGKLPDRRGYNFDGCAPGTLMARATVEKGRIHFPDGMSYRVLVLPDFKTMTPQLLRKIGELAQAGATVIGNPPEKSPSLQGFPDCDREVSALSAKIWNAANPAVLTPPDSKGELYPDYEVTAAILAGAGIVPDFASDASVRYVHRRLDDESDCYFIANREDKKSEAVCRFRISDRQPEWWNPLSGERRMLPRFEMKDGMTAIPMRLGPLESGFVVFRGKPQPGTGENFPPSGLFASLEGGWKVTFDPKWGGPGEVYFPELEDWRTRGEDGIRYYSGKAVYRKQFDVAAPGDSAVSLNLGSVCNLASVRLNGKDLGSVWCAPWQVNVPIGLLKDFGNQLEITVANQWINRLIKDSGLPEANRLTSTTRNPYKPNGTLQPSGLLGPVTLSFDGRSD